MSAVSHVSLARVVFLFRRSFPAITTASLLLVPCFREVSLLLGQLGFSWFPVSKQKKFLCHHDSLALVGYTRVASLQRSHSV